MISSHNRLDACERGHLLSPVRPAHIDARRKTCMVLRWSLRVFCPYSALSGGRSALVFLSPCFPFQDVAARHRSSCDRGSTVSGQGKYRRLRRWRGKHVFRKQPTKIVPRCQELKRTLTKLDVAEVNISRVVFKVPSNFCFFASWSFPKYC